MEDRPTAEVITPIIQEFLSYCPHSRPLRDLLGSHSNHTGFLAESESSSLVQTSTEDSSWTDNIHDEDYQDGYAEYAPMR